MVHTIVRSLQSSILKVSKIKPVRRDETSDKHRLVLLNPNVQVGLIGIDPTIMADTIQPLLSNGTVTETMGAYQVHYPHFTASEVFRRTIPNVTEFPAAFETAGHVAHINLRPELLPYKRLIGQVLLDKNVHITTVVNKTSSIATEFRTFPMELIAGVDDTKVEMKETGCKFYFDFKDVYWNSRLQHEHERIVKSLEKKQVVCDMMAGIGPFAVPAAKKGCLVYANDLNPKSYEYLVGNARLNRVEKNLNCYNLCGREFIREVVKQKITFHRVLMNLPATAIEFLDVFVGLLRENNGREWWSGASPLIQTYCFSSAENRTQDVLLRVSHVLCCNVEELVDASVREVRDVAPNKWMMCVSFRVPENILYGPERKRRRMEEVVVEAVVEE